MPLPDRRFASVRAHRQALYLPQFTVTNTTGTVQEPTSPGTSASQDAFSSRNRERGHLRECVSAIHEVVYYPHIFTEIVQSIDKLQKKCIIKFGEQEMRIICTGDANEGGIQVWS